MQKPNQKQVVRWAAAGTYVVAVAVNALANILPINGVTTAQVSDAYPNLFTPVGLTFSIWGVIYLLLALHCLFQFGVLLREKSEKHSELLFRVGIFFTVTNVANALWMLAWHYGALAVSVGLMLVLLVCLAVIELLLRRVVLAPAEAALLRLPFSIYFGWITVATIANITVWLVSIGWGRFGFAESAWAVAILVVGALIGGITGIRCNDIAYVLVIIWAYAGILIRHVSQQGYALQYPSVFYTALFCIAFLLMTLVYIRVKAVQAKQSAGPDHA